jgi:hypothetical protein
MSMQASKKAIPRRFGLGFEVFGDGRIAGRTYGHRGPRRRRPEHRLAGRGDRRRRHDDQDHIAGGGQGGRVGDLLGDGPDHVVDALPPPMAEHADRVTLLQKLKANAVAHKADAGDSDSGPVSGFVRHDTRFLRFLDHLFIGK